ncbi:MAG: MopE-related protein [Polyangiales bacterium]
MSRGHTQRCVAGPGGVGTTWGTCTGETLPSPDQCDGVDRNCDGNANTGCTCPAGTTRPCYTGPAGTSGVGICRPGTQTCMRVSTTSTSWGTACTGEILPGASEVCGNMRDDNCNGMVDEGCTTTPMCPTGFDLLNDRNNCGRCGNVCPTGQACANGVCVGDGQLRITLVWDRAGDLDLHVIPPCGTEISYRNLSACGGTLDHDDIPGTGPENVFWAGTPAAGTYVVCANPYGIAAGTTNFTLTVNRGTTLVRRFTGSRTGATGYVACSRTSANFVGTFTYP